MRTLIPRLASAVRNFFRPVAAPKFKKVLKQSMEYEAQINNLSPETQEKHRYQYNNILAFLYATSLVNIRIDQIRIRHMEQLRQWLHENVRQPGGRPISVDHSTRHLRMCRNACDYAVNQEYMDHNPIASVKTMRSAPKEIVYLSVEEVRRFERYHSERIPQRNVIRDLFLFQCFTGLSYMDLWRYEIAYDRGIYWVTSSAGRGKTKRRYWSEYLAKAEAIHEKYDGNLPRVSVQTYNRSIKKMAKELGITTYITTHIGRKTKANLMRHAGYSTPAIAASLGNTEAVCRTSYAAQGLEVILAERKRLSVA